MYSVKKSVSKEKITKKTPVSELNSVAGLRPATLVKKRLWHSFLWISQNLLEDLFIEHLRGAASDTSVKICLKKMLYKPSKEDAIETLEQGVKYVQS